MKRSLARVLVSLFTCAGVLGAYPVVVTDHDGHKVTIQSEPKRVAIVGGLWPLPSLIVALQGHSDNIIYVPKAAVAAIQHSVNKNLFSDKIVNGNSENIEHILTLKPDLIICHSSNIAICNQSRDSGVNTLSVSVSKWDYDSIRTLQGWLDVIAPALNIDAKSKKVYDHTQNVVDMVSKRVGNRKPVKAMIVHNYTQKEFYVGGRFADYLLKSSGAVNAFGGVEKVRLVGVEEIYNADVEAIYINNFNQLMPEDLLQSSEIFESKPYKKTKAVKNKRVFKFPLGTYRPFAPSLDLPVLILFMAKNNHPDLFKDINLIEEAKKYYHGVLGLKLSDEQIKSVFNPRREAGILK